MGTWDWKAGSFQGPPGLQLEWGRGRRRLWDLGRGFLLSEPTFPSVKGVACAPPPLKTPVQH